MDTFFLEEGNLQYLQQNMLSSGVLFQRPRGTDFFIVRWQLNREG